MGDTGQAIVQGPYGIGYKGSRMKGRHRVDGSVPVLTSKEMSEVKVPRDTAGLSYTQIEFPLVLSYTCSCC